MEDKVQQLIREVQQLKENIEEIKGIQCEGTVLETEEMLEDKDIIEIVSTTKYAEGKPIATTMEYKYKSNINQDIKCERNIYNCGIDGGDKDYQVTSYYDNNGSLIEEKIESINNKQ